MVKAALSVPSWLQDEMNSGPEHTEDELLAAIVKLRSELYPRQPDKLPEAGNAQTLLNALQKSGSFKSLTIQQVKKIDAKAMRNEQREREREAREEEDRRLAQEQAALEEEREEQDAGRAEMPRTDPLQCRVSGDGLSQVCARQQASFDVEAFDSKGRRRPIGGDVFVVGVRGPSKVKARVTDHGDGTYRVVWKPWCSGDYQVAISLFGVLLAGAPFDVSVVTTLPCPSKCIARGPALTSAISRHTHIFEVLFRDQLGQTAHAVDLDVFVEPVSQTSPRSRLDPNAEPEPEPVKADESKSFKKKRSANADAAPPQPEPQPAPQAPTPPGKPGQNRRGSIVGSPVSKGGKGAAALVVPEPAEEDEEDPESDTAAAPEEEEEEAGDVVETKYRKIRVKVGERPLILRKDVDKDSPMIGRLMPGAMVTVIEERVASTGETGGASSNAASGLSPDRSARDAAGGADADGPEFYGDGAEDEAAMLVEAAESAPLVGWVTLRKEGNRKLVTSRVKLGPGSRRQYTAQWVRRNDNNKREARKAGSLDVARLSTELTSDPTGIGFGFGGVEPGVLHAHGKLFDVHKVSYSIGLAGQYFLHVRLRQQAMPIPGSPFLLDVQPAPAHGHSSRLPSMPIRGTVGLGAEAGCMAVLRTADKMGNMCVQGKADVKIACESDNIESEITDHGDGSYTLRWRSKYSGHFKTHVTIDSIECLGSPTTIQLTSSTPELSKSEVDGAGLKNAVAGDKASIRIKFVDQFSNVAIPPPSMKFGMAFLKEKEKLSAAAPCHPFEQEWEAGDTGICELRYVASNAGACGLHIWCDPNSTDERIPLPGSPFPIHVSAGRAAPEVSVVDSWTKIVKEEKSMNKAGNQAGNNDPKLLYAGDTISIRPQIFDAYGNAAQLEEGALEVRHESPSGVLGPMPFTVNSRGGQTTYDIRHDATVSGVHKVHVCIHGTHIKGSPMSFTVHPNTPDPPGCKITPLEGGQLHANEQGRYLVLKTYDRFGNEVASGGLSVTHRLQLMKQGVHDQTALMPTNHKIEVEDMEDGSYHIHVFFQMPCVTKMVVNMDKNLPSNIAELAPITLHCVEDPNAGAEEPAKPVPALQRQATVSSLSRDSGLGSGRKSPKDDDSFKRRNAKLKGAAEEMMLGFGSAEERRDKDALIVAAEAFADGVDGFQFDKPMGEALKNDFKKAAAAAKDKKKAGKGMFGGLFDKS